MAAPKLEGRWIGYFSYGKSYSKELIGKKIPFTIEIINENGLIKGIFLDELSKNLFDKPATIEGKADDRSITFTKRYPGLLAIDEHNKPVAIPDKPSLPIQFTGTLKKKMFSNQYFVKGVWNISGSFINDKGFTNHYKFEGDWEMKPVQQASLSGYNR